MHRQDEVDRRQSLTLDRTDRIDRSNRESLRINNQCGALRRYYVGEQNPETMIQQSLASSVGEQVMEMASVWCLESKPKITGFSYRCTELSSTWISILTRISKDREEQSAP